MALQKDIIISANTNLSGVYTDFNYCTKNKEITLPKAYIKIDGLNGTKELINLSIGIYTSKDGNKIVSYNQAFKPDITDAAKNFIKQGYEYLKTLDEYKDAMDLLDEGQAA